MVDKAAKVTMLQRSPTYVVSRPAVDKIANTLRMLLPKTIAYAITRFKNVQMQRLMYNRSRSKPEKVKAFILNKVRKQLWSQLRYRQTLYPQLQPLGSTVVSGTPTLTYSSL